MSEKMQQSSVQGTKYDDQTTNALRSLVSEIMDLYAAPSSTKHELERLLSRTMKQGGDCAFSEQGLPTSRKWNMENQINVTGPRSLWLQFLNNISQPVFTGVPIKGDDCRPLMVALVDGHSGEVVTFGPEASAELEIVVLEADSGGCLGDNWTPEEFESKIVIKEGNRRLLTGDVVLHLKEGIGFVDVVRFSHTKIWKKKHAYGLGAIARDDYMRTKIREGFTKSFFVKDHRLDLNKKHYPPALSDEVWRLDGIARDGAFHQRLSDEKVNIYTVEDLLKKLNTDSLKLRDILGKGMSAKMWEVVVNHARTCILDEKLHLYSSLGSQQKTSVVFDVVGQVRGLLWEFQYVSFEMLSDSGKDHAMNLVVSAFQQWDKVVSFDNEASLFDNYLKPSNVVNYLEFPITKSFSSTKILISPKDDELHLSQPVICFDDKVSLSGEYPGLSNMVYPSKSPTVESINGSEILFSPLNDELDVHQLAVSFDDNVSLFDEPSSMSYNTCLPKSPLKESSSGTQILISQKDYDDDVALFGESSIISPSKSLIQESFSGREILISPDINEFGFSQLGVPSQEIIPTCDSVWEMDYYNDYNWQSIDSTSHSHESRLSYSSEMTDSDSWDAESVIRSWWEENNALPPNISGDNVVHESQGFILEPLDNLQNDGNGTLVAHPTVASINKARKRYLRNKAKRKWRVLFSVMKWLFVCRNAAGRLPIGRLQCQRSSWYQNMQALDKGKQPLTNGRDFATPTSYETKDLQIFSSNAPVLSRNLSMKSEASLHSTVNDILLARSIAVSTKLTSRRYMSKREKARRRWTKLYSVMRWFSVQRDVANRASSALTLRDPSDSPFLNNLSDIWAMDSPSYDSFLSSWDMCLNQQTPMNFASSFHEDEYVQLFNTFCSLQPRNRFAMNRLPRRRNAADGSFAKRKWKMLFSIMKWLSLRRSAARVKGPYNNC